MPIPNPRNTEVIVTTHARDQYLERVDPTASDGDILVALQSAKLIPKDTPDPEAAMLLAHTEPGCTYYFSKEQHVLFVTRHGHGAGRVPHIRLITVIVPEDRTPRTIRDYRDGGWDGGRDEVRPDFVITGHYDLSADPRHADGRRMHPVTTLKHRARELELQIQEFAPGSECRRRIGRELQDVQQQLAAVKRASA